MKQHLLVNNSTFSNFINEKESEDLNKMVSQNLEAEKGKEKNIFNTIYFTPESRFIIIWQLLNLFLIYIYFIQIPITIAFQTHRSQNQAQFVFAIINIPAIVIFITTVLIKLKTAFYKQGILRNNQKQVIINYLQYYAIFDFLAITSICIYQFSEILSNHAEPISYRFIVILFYLKLYEVFQIENNIINSFDLNRRIKAFLKLLRLLLKIFLLCNISACGFFYLSDSMCHGITDKICWIDWYQSRNGMHLREDTWIAQYIVSLYWASTTMISIGYGDVVPKNTEQIGYVIATEFGAALIFAYSLNALWSIVQQLNSKQSKINHRINVMNIYMRDKKVNSDLKSKVNAYLFHYYHTKNLRERDTQRQIINELTPSLRRELHYQTYGFIFHTNDFFRIFKEELLFQSSTKIYQTGFFQGQTLIRPFEINRGTSLHYIYKGKFMSSIPSKLQQITLQIYGSNTVIGLYQFVTQLSSRRIIKTMEYSLIYTLQDKDWKIALKDYQADFEKFFQIRYWIIYQNFLSKLGINQCLLCSQPYPDHITQRCFDSKIRRKYRKIVKKFKHQQPRAHFKRQKTKSGKVVSSIIECNQYRKRKQSFDEKNLSSNYLYKANISKLQSISAIQQSRLKFNNPHKNKLTKKINKQKHLKLMQNIIRQTKNDELDDSMQDEEYIMILAEINIDRVKNYENYFKPYNADAEGNRDKKGRLIASMALAI